MAEDLDDGEFWLPSQFLTDDDILMDNKNSNSRTNGAFTDVEAGFCFPSEFPGGFSSPLSSPVESVVGSTETERDDEDLMAGLTRQLACSILQDHHDQSPAPSFGTENSKARGLSGSPQSTLCGVESWSAYSAGSSRGSPNGPSQASWPPSTPMNGKNDAWDLLFAAAGQVVRMKMNDDIPDCYQGSGLLGPPRKHVPVSSIKNPNAPFSSNQALTHHQLQKNKFHRLKQQQVMKQQCSSVWGRQGNLGRTVQPRVNSRARAGGFGNGSCSRPLGLSASAWPPLQPQSQPQQQQQQQQQQMGSGMRAVFLGGSGSRRESTGTGFFLPRRVGDPSESHKKTACSTVLVPARVVQALNLNFDEMGAQPCFGGGLAYNHDVLLCQQKRSLRPQAAMNHGIRLPQEWTYCL